MAEYAKIVSGVVDQVIVCASDPVSLLGFSGTWILTPGKVGLGWKYSGGLFMSTLGDSVSGPVIAPAPLGFGVDACTDEGSPTWTYQWKKDSVDISGATSMTYTIDPSTASTDDGEYTCEVSDGTNTVTTDGCAVTVV